MLAHSEQLKTYMDLPAQLEAKTATVVELSCLLQAKSDRVTELAQLLEQAQGNVTMLLTAKQNIQTELAAAKDELSALRLLKPTAPSRTNSAPSGMNSATSVPASTALPHEVVTSTEVVTVPDDRSDVPPSTDHSAQGEMPPAEQPRSPPAAAETATASQAKGGDALD